MAPAACTLARQLHRQVPRRGQAPPAWLLLASAAAGLLRVQSPAFCLLPGSSRSSWRPGGPVRSPLRVARRAEEATQVDAEATKRRRKYKNRAKRRQQGQEQRPGDSLYKVSSCDGGGGRTSWVAEVQLPHFEGKPTRRGDPCSSRTLAKLSAAEAMMVELANMAVLKNVTVGRVGGKVTGFNNKGWFLDIGADVEAFLPVAEHGRGFPRIRPPEFKKNDFLMVDILREDEEGNIIWVTKRGVSATRPPKEEMSFDASDLQGFLAGQWFDVQVIDFDQDMAYVKVPRFDGGPPVGARLMREDCVHDVKLNIMLGSLVRVRSKVIEPETGLLYMTMMDDLGVGQTVTGTVYAKRVDGVKLDLGRFGTGFMPALEFENTSLSAFAAIKQGKRVEARVYSKASSFPLLTMKSGDLGRPRIERPDSNKSLEPFAAVPPDQWLQGQVFELRKEGMIALVKVAHGGEWAVGRLSRRDMAPSFADDICFGSPVKVRVTSVDLWLEQLRLTMKDANEEGAGSGEPPLKEGAGSGEPPPSASPPAAALPDQERPAPAPKPLSKKPKDLGNSLFRRA